MIADAPARAAALDPARSFIVDAPAGSGKTELLIQRYLALLARVRQPEEIVAITFTVKAAAEMRGRILQALDDAAGEEPQESHQRLTWVLARAALDNDRRQTWELRDNPSRLRVQTIDSLCASLTRQMPFLSRFGAQPGIAEMPEDLYREAARNLIRRAPACALAALAHLDNRYENLTTLLVNMLGCRDQWLRHVVSGADRGQLDADLCGVIRESLARLRAALPAELHAELVEVARLAAAGMSGDSPLSRCLGLAALPGCEPADKPLWDGLACLLLTASGAWRARLDKNCGFPPGNKLFQDRGAALIAALSRTPGLLDGLAELSVLPPAAITDAQWEILQALCELLKLAEAELRLVFAERGEVDFIEVARRAELALGSDEYPTDLALALDSRIQHLLVDEFQDTSGAQYRLLRLLTAGWERGDGRTLFVVGDPMQSIYRFREAQVGLFVKVRRDGIGTVALEPLRLTVNFRSHPGMVEWVNRSFATVFPGQDDIVTGAIRQSISVANQEGEGEPVEVLAVDADEESRRVCELVQEARRRRPDDRVAVLVRARTHLPAILEQMRRAGLRYRAIEIDTLGERAVIQDLLALTRALLDPADRTAWLAVLRAPWCGLTLADLHALAAAAGPGAVWDALASAPLSADGALRAGRVREVLGVCMGQTRRLPLRRVVEGAWTALGGPACLAGPTGREDARAFLELLEGLETGGEIDDPAALGQRVDRLFAAPDREADGKIEVLTIHKAKGLEWDTVILPGLGRRGRHDDPPLLRWLEAPAETGDARLLLAPIQAPGAGDDPIGSYLKYIEAQREKHEQGRLLYVAATRARRRLCLLASAPQGRPAGGSLLARIWDGVKGHFAPREEPTAAEAAAPARQPVAIRRLPSGWTLPETPPGVRWTAPAEEERRAEAVTFQWVGDTLRHVGTVAHRLLQRVAESGGPDAWDEARVRDRVPAIGAALADLGVPPEELPAARDHVLRAVLATLADPRGRWTLAPRAGHRSEFALAGVLDGRVVSGQIDRTFLDERGIRWIVDFKTSAHQGGSLEEFLDREQERYRRQLEGYAALFALWEARPVRVGLYFPLLGGWREWEPGPGAQPAAAGAEAC